jgi:pimeloyl-ACP methyl ester carboxylesterase
VTAAPSSGTAEVRRTLHAVDGIRFPVLSSGPSHDPEAVVLFHGNPGSCEDWRHLVASVGGLARSVAFDQPGFGRADKPAGFDHSYRGHARHLERVLDHLGVDRAHLVGQDLGARWMLDFAALRPHRVASAVVIAGGVLLDYRWHYLARIWGTPVLGEAFMATPSRRVFRMLLDKDEPRPLPRAFVDRMYDDMDRWTRRAILSLYRPDFDWNARSHELARTLRKLDLPALVVWGAHDRYIPVAQAARQLVSLPSAETVVLPASGHWPHVDDPAGVDAAVVPFLRRHLGRRS